LVDDELESLREKRKRELLAQQLKKDLAQKQQDKALQKEQERTIRSTMIISEVLEPDAQVYMQWLNQKNPPIAQTIKDTIIMLMYKNELRKKISKIDLVKIERELTGQESKIQIKRRGREATDLNSEMKKEN